MRPSLRSADGAEVDVVGGRDGGDDSRSAPTAFATEPGRLPVSEVPFAWQHGRRLLLLDEEAEGWTFAEFRFDNVDCRYVEVRRATFRWPREAAGVLLAHGVAFGPEPVERLAGSLDRWLTVHVSAAGPKSSAGASANAK